MIWSKLLALYPVVGLAIATGHPPGKRGLASNDGLDLSGFENTPLQGQSKVRWQYNWDSDISDNKLSFAEYVPMLHSLHHGHEIVWNDRVNKWLSQGTAHLLAFNEPERPLPQAAMTVGDAVDAWWRYMEPRFKGLGGSSQEDIVFLQKAMAFLEGNSCVERYAYFGTANNDLSLLSNEHSRLSELGTHYALD